MPASAPKGALKARMAFGMAQQAAEKLNLPRKGRPLGLKPAAIFKALRGPEGPLFHGCVDIREFFRSLSSDDLIRIWSFRKLLAPPKTLAHSGNCGGP